jgi:chemotaxis protein CheD
MPEKAIGLLRAQRGADLHLLAGQLYFGTQAARVRTLLGSCVAVTLWHPQRRIGGMCHFLLPSRTRDATMPRDGRFGEEAIGLMVEALLRAGTRPQEYEAHLYGGADTMPDHVGVKLNVGERNIELGWALIEDHGFQLMAVDVGDEVPRNVSMDMLTGQVEMRRGQPRQAVGRQAA